MGSAPVTKSRTTALPCLSGSETPTMTLPSNKHHLSKRHPSMRRGSHVRERLTVQEGAC